MNLPNKNFLTFVKKDDLEELNNLVEKLLILRLKRELLRGKRDCFSIGELIEIQEKYEQTLNELLGLVLASSLSLEEKL